MGDHRWRGYAHPELYDMINSGPGVAASRPIEDKWKALSEALGEIDTSIHQGLERLGASWEGSSATETRAALSPLGEWATDAQRGSDVMKTSAQLQGEYIADARKEMPEPVPVTTEAPSTGDKVLGALAGPFGMMHVIQQQEDHERQEAAQDNAEAKAVEVMNNYQSSSEWNSSTLGEFVPPPKVVVDTPPPAGVGQFNSTSAGYTSTPTWTPPGEGGTTHASWAPPSTGTQVAPVTQVPGQPPTGGTTNPSWATPPPTPTPPPSLPPPPPPGVKPPVVGPFPPGWTPPRPPGGGLPLPPRGPGLPGGPGVKPGLPPTGGRPGLPGPGVPGGPGGPGGQRPGVPTGPGQFRGMPGGPGGMPGGVPGGPGGPGGFGPGGPHAAGRPGGPGMPGPGGFGPGGPGGPAGGRPGAPGAPGAAGRGPGAGGGVAGGQGANGEDDIEHKAADYLVETNDVFGDDRLVAPPVIGEVQQ
ncbi:PPE domain-containing protein, partial [Saccharothrix sp. Mg75]|uniref:PPE domain-containing protein n=1 Tax=Saccharothrix sp. Mg75 TaxID=3445357 RepID=UPI003EEB7EA5